MSLTFYSNNKSFEAKWISYALLRDNIQHHLENGTPSDTFSNVHSVTQALGGHSVKLPARALRSEIEQAAKALRSLPISQLAISGRTLSVISMSWPSVDDPHTQLIGSLHVVPWISTTATALDGVFGGLIDSLLRITEDASPDQMVEVIDT